MRSHPSRGAWIEISHSTVTVLKTLSHPSRGAWIEIKIKESSIHAPKSHPSRGAWIEMLDPGSMFQPWPSHPSRGAWIEIPPATSGNASCGRRTPHGVRGLKSDGRIDRLLRVMSHPSRGAWIEIGGHGPVEGEGGRTPHGVRGLKSARVYRYQLLQCRTPHGVRGLKFPRREPLERQPGSHPSRGAWIEIANGKRAV